MIFFFWGGGGGSKEKGNFGIKCVRRKCGVLCPLYFWERVWSESGMGAESLPQVELRLKRQGPVCDWLRGHFS